MRLHTVGELSLSSSVKKVRDTPTKLMNPTPLQVDVLETKINARIQGSKVLLKTAAQNNHSGSQSIIHCVLWQSTRLLEAFLDQEPTDAHRISRANAADQFGKTALHYACAIGFKPGVLILMQVGANSRLADNLGRTALHYATWTNDPSIFAAVQHPKKLAKRSHQNFHSVARLWTYKQLSRAPNSQTDVIQPAQPYQLQLDVEALPEDLQALVKEMTAGQVHQDPQSAGASFVDIVDKEGRTPLFHAVARGSVTLVTELLMLGANPKHEDVYGNRPSEVTTDSGILSVFARFLKRTQYSLDSQLSDMRDFSILNSKEVLVTLGETKDTYLIRVIKKRNLAAARVILQKGVSPLQANKHKWNAVHFAFKIGYLPLVKLLLEGDEKVTMDTLGLKPWVVPAWKALDERTIEGLTALHLAALGPNPELLKCLLAFYQKRASMLVAADRPSILIDPFLRLEEVIEAHCNKGLTPLLSAAMHQRFTNVGLLLDAGSNRYALTGNLQNLLHLVSIHSIFPLIRTLIYLDSDTNRLRSQQDHRGRTPQSFAPPHSNRGWYMHIWDFAKDGMSIALQQCIVDGSCSINQQTPVQKLTPLYVAVLHKQLAVARLIVELGGNCNLATSAGVSAVDVVQSWPDSSEKIEWSWTLKLVPRPRPVSAKPLLAVVSEGVSAQTRYSGIWTSIVIKIQERVSSVLDLFTLLGKNLNDNISYEEFNALLLWLGVELPSADVRKLFEVLDADKSGTIEYQEIFEATGSSVSAKNG